MRFIIIPKNKNSNILIVMKRFFSIIVVVLLSVTAFATKPNPSSAPTAVPGQVRNANVAAQAPMMKRDTMKVAMFIESGDIEQVVNAFDVAIVLARQGEKVRVLLMGAAVAVDTMVDGNFNVPMKIEEFVRLGGDIHSLNTSNRIHQIQPNENCPEASNIVSVGMLRWATKVLVF